jgi:hypothetical protein
MSLLPHIAAVLYIIAGVGGIAFLIREWLWLRHCRYLHDQAAKRGQDPDPEKLIQAARGGTLQRLAERLPLPRKPDEPMDASAFFDG